MHGFSLFRTGQRIIKSLFWRDSLENDSKFYLWVGYKYPHWCVNCGLSLKEYWAGYISHIYIGGCIPIMKDDPLNTNILCK